MTRGLFITFEGGEGAGKSTLLEEIAKHLLTEGHTILKTREPGGTELGEKIRALLLHKGKMTPHAELCLFLASRSQHIHEVILPALREGKIVLCDRFNDSTIAYQGAARALGVEPVSSFCKFISEDLEPHLTLYLDIDPALGLSRIRRAKDRLEAETLAFHADIREAFLRLAVAHPKRIHRIDASLSPNKVFDQSLSLVMKKLRALSFERGPL